MDANVTCAVTLTPEDDSEVLICFVFYVGGGLFYQRPHLSLFKWKKIPFKLYLKFLL